MAASLPTASGGTHGAQWYYYLQKDPFNRLPDGWYGYESSLNQTVEQLFQNYQQQRGGHKRDRHLVPLTATSGFSYELDFLRMTQKNTVSKKERPIFRTTDGKPPQFPPGSTPALAAPVTSAQQITAAPPNSLRSQRAVQSGARGGVSATIIYTAPERLREIHIRDDQVFDDIGRLSEKPKAHGIDDEKKQESHDDDCAICLDPYRNGERVVSLKACQHKFHYKCIHESLSQSSAKCPLCSRSVHHEAKTAKGKCPSGTMTVHLDPHTQCAGFPDANGTLTITYDIQGGIQKEYHQNPGQRFLGAIRIAYLPNNQQGKDLCERMKYAFAHGLSFMVGTSLTTGHSNVVTWASIHHKTSTGPGPYGYPDDTYMDRSNDELNNAGVPDAAHCRQWLDENARGGTC